MPLKLVTGPANAAKAGAVLGSLRGRLAEEPVLVVPSFADVEHSQRELADRGAVFGASVVRFSALFRLMAARAGVAGRPASRLQRQLVVEEAVRRSRLELLAPSAERPGFARAAERFVAELGRSRVEPARFTRALRDWAGEGPRRRYADEVAEVYRRYRESLEAAGLLDEELFAQSALAALREEPATWGATPVFAYGFDDFTPLELAAVGALAGPAATDVVVSLPYEPGREAFKATERIHDELAELADDVTQLEAVSDHYDAGSRKALHALERGLFEPGAPTADSRGAVRLHICGGERAELELCGAEVLRALRDGTPPGEVAVVFRDPADYASLVEQVFGAYGIPYSIDRSVALAHTGLGRGLLALLRCALLDGSADDLLSYLRTPGHLRRPELADRLESEVRREGVDDARRARGIWQAQNERWPLEELDRLQRARSPAELLEELRACLRGLFAGPYRRAAHVLRGSELDDARTYRTAHEAIDELQAVMEADPSFALDANRLHDTLAALPVRVGESPQPDRVQVSSPLGIRARRFEVVFVCGLQEGEFPRRAAPEPFLTDTDRRAIAAASGLVLPLREDQLERERYLFYVCVSRAERLLVLSSRPCDEEGNPDPPSFFLDDVDALISDLASHVRTRSLADVTWTHEAAPTESEWERAMAAAGPRRRADPVGPLDAPAAVSELRGREVVSAGALERFAGCPVKWLVEDVLRPEKLEPDPEQMVRGSYAHRVLELTMRRVREQTGSSRVTDGNLAAAERILLGALEELRGEFRLSPNQTRVRAAVRRLEFDLLRYLRHEAGRDGLFEPEHLELRFGFEDSDHPAVELEGGTRVRGVVDRVDTWDGHALVRDYKSGKVERYRASLWESDGHLQAALYMLVVERALGLRAAGGVYVPLGGRDRRSRGLVAAELTEELGSDFVDPDRRPREEFDEYIDRALAQITEVAEQMRTGRLSSCPDSCAYRGGCAYPSICRVEQ